MNLQIQINFFELSKLLILSKLETKHYLSCSKEIFWNLEKNLHIQLNEEESIKGNITVTNQNGCFFQNFWNSYGLDKHLYFIVQCAWLKVAKECLTEEINENFGIYLQIKIWLFANHSIFEKSGTQVRMCVERGEHDVCSQKFW